MQKSVYLTTSKSGSQISHRHLNADNRSIANVLLPIALFGFWATAPIFAILENYTGFDGATISIIYRSGVLITSIFVLMKLTTKYSNTLIIAPMIIFSVFYSLRMYDNYFIQGFNIYVPSFLSFSQFLGSCIIPAIAIYFSATSKAFSDQKIRRIMYFLFLIFAIGVFLNADVLYERETQQASLERVNSIALSSLATSFLIFAILSFPKSKPINFMLNCICVVVSATVLALSQARGPILATLVALILYFFMVSASGRKNLITVSAGAAILLVAVEFLSGGGFLIEAFARFYAVQDGGAGDSVTMRTVAWENSWYQFLDDPIFGKFMFETTFNHYPHNIFLESLIATGVIGTFFLLFHIVLTIKASFFVLKSGNASLSHAFIVIIFLKETTQNMFSGALWGATGFFIASGCILGIAQHLSVAGNHDGGGRQFRIRK